MPPAYPTRHLQTGFVLVATLWILAVVTIAAGFFALWTQRAVDAATALQADMQTQIDVHDTRETLLYLLSTGMRNAEGLRVLDGVPLAPVFDDPNPDPLGPVSRIVIPPDAPRLVFSEQVYQGRGDSVFALQDEGGLLNINNPTHVQRLHALLAYLEVPGEKRDALSDSLKDYIDIDNLRRLNGAEAREYNKLDLLPPTNRMLHNFSEIQRIYGWQDIFAATQYAQWSRYVTSALTVAHPNFNSAPEALLMVYYELSLAEARLIVAARAQQALNSLTQINTVVGRDLSLDPFSTSFMPSSYIRITLIDGERRNLLRLHIHLTHADPVAPWQVLQQYTIPWQDFYAMPAEPVAATYFADARAKGKHFVTDD